MLEVAGLKTYFFTRAGVLKAVDGLSFSLNRSETLAVDVVFAAPSNGVSSKVGDGIGVRIGIAKAG